MSPAHQCAGTTGRHTDADKAEAATPWPDGENRVPQHHDGCLHQSPGWGALQGSEPGYDSSLQSGGALGHLPPGGSLAWHGQCPGGIPILDPSRSYLMEPGQGYYEDPVPHVGDSPYRRVRVPEEQSPSSVVQSHSPSRSGCLRCPDPTFDRVVPVRLSPIRRSTESSDEDQRGSVRGSHSDSPTWPRRSWYHLLLQLACEVPL